MPFTAYATQEDMTTAPWGGELVTLTNIDDSAASSINVAVLEQALRDGAAEIDSYLGGRYDLAAVHALDPLPRVLMLHNRIIARKILDSTSPRDAVIDDYKATIRFLERLQTGVATLGLETPAEGGDDAPVYKAPEPVFSRETLSDYAAF
ncbi:MAG: gp436 family protein [Leptolyngbyaceae cyanobacterium]